jgi:hypothetical protein
VTRDQFLALMLRYCRLGAMLRDDPDIDDLDLPTTKNARAGAGLARPGRSRFA